MLAVREAYLGGTNPNEGFGLTLAGWWRRACGLVIDVIVIVMFGELIRQVLGGSIGAVRAEGSIAFVVTIGYGWILIRNYGATLGMWIVRIMAIDGHDWKKLSSAKSLNRALVAFVLTGGLNELSLLGLRAPRHGAGAVIAAVVVMLSTLGLVTYLWPLWDRHNRTLQDKAVGAVVVCRTVSPRSLDAVD